MNSRSSHLHGGMFRPEEGRGFSGDGLLTVGMCAENRRVRMVEAGRVG